MTDLYVTAERATTDEVAAIDAALAEIGVEVAVSVEDERLVRGGRERRRSRRHGLLPALHALQRESGWISPGGLNHIAEALQIPPAEAFGVASFYDLFRVDGSPALDAHGSLDVVHVCIDAACQISGAAELMNTQRAAGRTVHESPCLGLCEQAPAMFVQGHRTADQVHGLGPDPHRSELPNLADYVAAGGFEALRIALERGPEWVIGELKTSGLTGRGGAGFPTGLKWAAVAAEAGPRHVVVNADESEPGTFKDRVTMENDPFAVIEAMTIAAVTVGATQGWIYIRGEYPLAAARLHAALDLARTAGYVGADVCGSGREFEVQIRRGAGAYVCGEETALFNSLEGFRGEPRQKPPFPVTHGLFGQPTVINNPETLVNVLRIVRDGGAAYAATGTAGSPGTKMFCLSGHVARPGMYDVEFGATLGDVLELAGGVVGDLRAVLLGGAAGSFVSADSLSMPLTMEATRERGLSLGSGVVMAFNASTDFDAVVTRLAKFFRDESCGQCVPCRVGVVRQHEILVRSRGRVGRNDLQLLDDLDRAMKDASICGLGHTAGNAVRSAIELGLVGAER